MKRQKDRGSGLFLIELMIAIFFFLVMATICVQVFAEAHTLSMKSQELMQSVNLVSNVAETYRVWDGQQEGWQEIYPEGEWSNKCWQISYDANWKPKEAQGKYLLQMELSEQGGVSLAQISLAERKSERVIYELAVERKQ